MSDPNTNTEGGSFAERPVEEEKRDRPQVPSKPEDDTIFTYLKQIIGAIEAKEAQLAHHLDRIATALETIAKKERDKEDLKKAPTSVPAPTLAPKSVIPTPPEPIPAPTPVSQFIDTVKALFPKDLEVMLMFIEEKAGTVIIKPRQYLGSENFAKIASIVRSTNGEYVSAGKESHFRVVKK